jgi:hypothetical protein
MLRRGRQSRSCVRPDRAGCCADRGYYRAGKPIKLGDGDYVARGQGSHELVELSTASGRLAGLLLAVNPLAASSAERFDLGRVVLSPEDTRAHP